MGKRKLALGLSLALMLVSIGSLIAQGLNLGIDFTGGTLVEVGYQQPVDTAQARATLAAEGFVDATVQHFGTTRDLLVRLAPQDELSSSDLSLSLIHI